MKNWGLHQLAKSTRQLRLKDGIKNSSYNIRGVCNGSTSDIPQSLKCGRLPVETSLMAMCCEWTGVSTKDMAVDPDRSINKCML